MSFILLGILNAQAEAAGGSSYDLLETEILASDAASVTFTGLGSYSDYKHLQIRVSAQSTRGSDADNLEVFLNGDSNTGNYRIHGMQGRTDTSTISAFEDGGFDIASGLTASGSEFGADIIDILDFSNSSKNTTMRIFGGYSDRLIYQSTGYFNTSAITSITLQPDTGPNFATNSRFSLYGIRG